MWPSPAVRLSLLVLLSSSVLPLASASTINVPGDYSTIQAAIDAASNGDTILVAAGTYKENINFKGKAITLKSASGAAATIIDGGNVGTVVQFTTNETSASILDGFTVTHGNSSGLTIGNASPTIRNNIITANTGCGGNGINVSSASPLIQNNTISNNSQAGCSGGVGGGGIEVVAASSGTVQIIGNTITGNNAGDGYDGGGIGLWTPGAVLVQNNFISGNTSNNGGGIGGANDTSAVRIIQNVIYANTAVIGGGISIDNYVSLILNNTIANNNSSNGSAFYGAFSASIGAMSVINNLIIGMSGQSALGCRVFDTANPITFSHNDVFSPSVNGYGSGCVDQSGLNGNIYAAPLFVNDTSDFHLEPTSPAIDAGDNSAPDLPSQDIASNPRIVDGNGDCVATVDLGAYEFTRTSSLTISPTVLAFPDTVVGATSIPLSSTVTNNSVNTTTVCTLRLSGDFAQTNTCGSAILSNASCSVTVSFTPTAHGVRSGSLQVVTSDAAIGQNIALSGNGVLPTVSLPVTSLNFAPQIVGSTSSTQAITLNNTGDGPLSISNVTISGDFSQSSTCGNTVVPVASCTFSISFAPTATGNRSGTLTITDDASGSPHSVALSGTGTDFSLSLASGGSTSASITAGRTVTYNLQLTPVSGFFGTVTLACSGVPNLATCTVSPNSITPGNATPFSVSVSTTAASLAPPFTAPRIPPLRILPLILLACAAAFLPFSSATSHTPVVSGPLFWFPLWLFYLFARFPLLREEVVAHQTTPARRIPARPKGPTLSLYPELPAAKPAPSP